MGRIKEIKDTLGSAIEKGKDLVVGGSRQIADVFGNRDVVEQYQADIQVQTGYGSTKDILKTIDIFLNNECVNEGDKVKLLDEVIRKTSSTCVKYRALFYRASLLIKIAESCEEPAYLYVSAIEHLYQAIGEFFQENSESPDNPSVAQKWGRSISDAFKALEKGFAEEIHSATLGWLGSDAGDPKGELAKSFKEFPASKRLDRIDVNEQNCISFSQYLIACSYEKINQIDDARRWFIRSCSSKSPAIQLQAKEGYNRVNNLYIQSFLHMKPEARANVIFFKSLEAMAGFYDPWKAIIPFEMNSIPPGMTYSTNRPIAGALYQIHPCVDTHYVEYEHYDKIIFNEQISDFLRLCQGVGADSVEFEDIEGTRIEEDELSKFAVELNAGTKEEKGGANHQTTQKVNRKTRQTYAAKKTLKLGHIKRLAVPEDLIWADKEGWSDGNDLIKAFRSGVRLVDFNAKFKTSSYQKDHLYSDANLKASYKKMAASVSGSINQSEDTTFTQQESKQWTLHVHFAKRGFAGFIERLLNLFKGDK